MGGPMTTASGQVARNGVLAMLGVLLVSSTMGQPQSDPLRLSKRSSMDLRLSKRALTDRLVELDNLPESSLLEYESPLFENMDKREVMENLEKRESMLRLSKRDLLRLSKRDLLRLSTRAPLDEMRGNFDLLTVSPREPLRRSTETETD